MVTLRKHFLLGLIPIAAVGAILIFAFGRKTAERSPACSQDFDLIIAGAEVIDGSGQPAFQADIGIKNKRIACIGNLASAKSQRIIDAHGLTVAPGFIDVHTHVERNVPTGSPFLAPNFIRQGVTSIITGNCGRSFLDLGKFYKSLEANRSEVNVASLIGHNTVRQSVMGQSSSAPSAKQLEQMKDLVERAMSDGAFGMSTGLVYIPGTFATTDELVGLMTPVARQHGLYVSHIRDEGAQGDRAIREAISIGERTGAHVHISHFKAQGAGQWGSALARLQLVKNAEAQGQIVSLDQYPYNASSTGLAVLLPSWLSDGDLATATSKLNDPPTRARVRSEMLTQLHGNGWSDYSFAHVAYCQFDPTLVGLSIAEIADRSVVAQAPAHHVGASDTAFTGQASFSETSDRAIKQADTIINLFKRGGAQMVYFDMSEADVETIIKDSAVMFGTDSGVRGDEGASRPHPRGFGTFPRVLGFYARERALFTIEEAVRRMTSLPAQTFGISDRGYIRNNYWADLVVFDRNRIMDRATYEEPFTAPDGIAYVVVNGSVAMDQNGPTMVNQGMVIRHLGP